MPSAISALRGGGTPIDDAGQRRTAGGASHSALELARVSTPMKRCRYGARIDATPGVGGMFNTLRLEQPRGTFHT
jgi:hypothetical protein